MERERPSDRAPPRPPSLNSARPPWVRRSGSPDLPKGDRRLVALEGSPLQVEAFPWTGGLVLWTQDADGRWVKVPLRR